MYFSTNLTVITSMGMKFWGHVVHVGEEKYMWGFGERNWGKANIWRI